MTRVKKEPKEVAYTHYLAVVPNHWGKGASIEEAKKKLRQQVGRAPKGVTLYQIPADYYIDDYGSGCGSAPAKLLSGTDLRT
ncbi:MAG: hypothetical protein E6Q97_22560 [Desulfurellales bacterium]|nr:MAG: hypothetical protein E6Q97_22560 [Desulfurellales bacterium]